MTTISSPHNEQLKEIRRLSRRRERERSGLFVAEGEDLVAAAAAAGRIPRFGYRRAGTGLGGPAFVDVEPGALAAVSALGSGSRVLAVYEQRWSAPAGPLCVYLHDVHDPGNVGAVLRSALAFGASSVVLGPGCADPHGPKAVRASMGAVFAVTLARVASLDELPGELIALVPGGGPALRGPAAGPLSLVVGGERRGVPQELLDACDGIAHIPIASDSLNAAMAATVALYEMTRLPDS